MRVKIISFIIGCVIGAILGGIQINAWAMPVGFTELSKYGQDIQDAEEYMETNYIDIPFEVEEACEKYGEEYNIIPEIGEALCWRESRCTANAKNGSCRGIAQINVNVHQSRMEKLGVSDINDIDGNVHIAFDYLNDLVEDNGDIAKSLDEYNGNHQGGKSNYAKQILTVASILDRTGGD